MRRHLPNWLRHVLQSNVVSGAGVVSPLVPEVVSGVSRGGSGPRLVGSLSAVGLSLVVTSCAEPNLDGLPEDPGQNLPLPTMGPPPAPDIDAGLTSTQDEADDDDAATGGEQSEDTTDLPVDEADAGSEQNTDVSPDTDTTDDTGTNTVTNTSAGEVTSSHTDGTTSAESSEPNGSQGTETETTATSNTSDDTDDTDDTTTDAVEADAGVWEPADAGEPTDDSSDETSVEPDAGDAGDGGLDGGVDP